MGNLFFFLNFGSDGGFYFKNIILNLRGRGGFWGLFIYLYLRGLLGFWSGDDFFLVCNVRINGLNMGLFCERGGGGVG